VKLGDRIARAETQIRRTADLAARDCKGLEWGELLERVGAALEAGCGDSAEAAEVLGRVLGWCGVRPKGEAAGPAKEDDPDDEDDRWPHPFLEFCWALSWGWFPLPDRLTLPWLKTFDRRYCALLFGCEDCRGAWANAASHGGGGCILCGGKVRVRDISTRAGGRWLFVGDPAPPREGDGHAAADHP
jgi:hypothetical protein